MLTNSIHKFVYIDIPKTGSCSIEEVFNKYKSDWKHPKAFEDTTYKHSRQIPNFAKDYYKIASVRNPYDRIISFYYYFMERHLVIKPYMESFEKFLDYAIE